MTDEDRVLGALVVAARRRDEVAMAALADLLVEADGGTLLACLRGLCGLSSRLTSSSLSVRDFLGLLADRAGRGRPPCSVRMHKALISRVYELAGRERGDPSFTLADLAQFTGAELMRGIKNFGETTLAELRHALWEVARVCLADQVYPPVRQPTPDPA